MLTALLVLDGPAPASLCALEALAAAIDHAEAAGVEVAAVVVDDTGGPDLDPLLAGVEGATVLHHRMPLGRARSWAAAAEHATTERVWLGASDLAIAPETLAELARAEAGPDEALLCARPAACAAVARAAVRAAPDDDGAPFGRWLRRFTTPRALQDGDSGPLPSDGSRVVTSHPGVDIDVAHPEAFRIGALSYLSPGSVVKTWGPIERIELGAACSLADEVRLLHPGGGTYFDAGGAPIDLPLRGGHRPQSATTFPIGILAPPDAAVLDPATSPEATTTPLRIGNDVWIGYGAMVVGGVEIGDGAVIGAGAVVARDVEPYAIVAGNPARVLRHRFEPDVIARLQRVAWWTWPPEIVAASWPRLAGAVEELLDHADPAHA